LNRPSGSFRMTPKRAWSMEHCCSTTGRPETKSRAIELLKQAIVADDSSVEARYQLANIELTDGNLQAALQRLESAIKLQPNDSRLHFALSRVYRLLDCKSEADQEIQIIRS
jgi:Tfp pilus assembly protein PilF